MTSCWVAFVPQNSVYKMHTSLFLSTNCTFGKIMLSPSKFVLEISSDNSLRSLLVVHWSSKKMKVESRGDSNFSSSKVTQTLGNFMQV